MSSILQHGVELLRQKTDAKTEEAEALRELLLSRLRRPMVSATEMGGRVDAMIARKRYREMKKRERNT